MHFGQCQENQKKKGKNLCNIVCGSTTVDKD